VYSLDFDVHLLRHKIIIAEIINTINRNKRNYKLWESIECAKTNKNTVTSWSDYRLGFGLEIRFIDHLTHNYQ
jgi:hypothetical protein